MDDPPHTSGRYVDKPSPPAASVDAALSLLATRPAEAERICRLLLARGDSTPDVRVLQALAWLCRGSGRSAEAVGLLRRAVDARPDDPECLNNLASVLIG